MKKVFRKCYKCGVTNETPGIKWHQGRSANDGRRIVWICHKCAIRALEERRSIKVEGGE